MRSPRFCIAEQHGLQEPKYRLIDDLAKSLVNGAVETTENLLPARLRFVRGPYSFTKIPRLAPSAGLVADFSHAYETIAIHPGSDEASYICIINHADNRPYTARILAQPLGSRGAPANWGRVVTFIQFVALKLLYIAVGAFVGDVYFAEDAKIANSGFWAFKQLCRLLGFNTSDKRVEYMRLA